MAAVDANQPSSVSKPVHDILRSDMKFNGVIMTDDMDMAGLADFMTQDEAGVKAIEAGNDMIMGSHYQTQIPAIVSSVKSGQISEKQIDTSVKRILQWKEKLGLLKF
jgi:beta-N-acetylhexosaminidase